VDVKQAAANLEAMLKLSNGQRQVPVIVKGSEVTIGFGGT
jgi:glutaredoxin